MKSKSRRGEEVRSPRLFGNGSHFSWGRKKNWVLLAEFFLSKRKKNLAGTLSGKVLANPTEVDTIWGNTQPNFIWMMGWTVR